jgi:glycine cleavage system H protein
VNPDDRHYTRSHEWVRLDGDIGTIGITEHAQKELGEIVYLELPEVGHLFKADEEFGTVESVKAVSELYIPITGEVVEVNAAAVAEPGIVNEDAFGDGWLVKVRIGSNQELEGLLTAAQYDEYLREEEKAR